MVYPSKAQTRYIAGLALVFGLIATTGYVVTQTNSTERMKMSGVRTHDITLPAVGPSAAERARALQHGIGFIGAANGAPDVVSAQPSVDAMAFATALPGSAGSSFSATGGGSRNFTGGNYIMARTHGAGGTGFSAGGFGMGGVGAWGGVSGHVPAGSGIAAAAAAPRLAFRPAASGATSSGTKKSSPPSSGTVAGASGSVSPTSDSAPVTIVADAGTGLAGGGSFSGGTGSTPGDPGSVPAVDGGDGSSSPGSSPAPNPEPMTLLLMGTGLAGLYKARHYLQ